MSRLCRPITKANRPWSSLGILAMMARWLLTLIVVTLSASSGCCCFSCQGGSCGQCCFCLPKPIVWDGCCNDCGPHGQPCGSQCGTCGILPWLIYGKTCGKGCGDIYWGEWVSDPPDCCDPCDKCTGCWTGQRGPCCLGPCQRLLAAFHGYSYCPPPNCGPSCGPLCQNPACGAACGCSHCGGVGCSSCGAGPHGANVYYGGPEALPDGTATPDLAPGNILDEDWNFPKSKPEPGRPMQKAQQPTRTQMSRMLPPRPATPTNRPYPPTRQASSNSAWGGRNVQPTQFQQ